MRGWFGYLFTAVNFRDADFIGHLGTLLLFRTLER
jgi:hypothetical protein